MVLESKYWFTWSCYSNLSSEMNVKLCRSWPQLWNPWDRTHPRRNYGRWSWRWEEVAFRIFNLNLLEDFFLINRIFYMNILKRPLPGYSESLFGIFLQVVFLINQIFSLCLVSFWWIQFSLNLLSFWWIETFSTNLLPFWWTRSSVLIFCLSGEPILQLKSFVFLVNPNLEFRPFIFLVNLNLKFKSVVVLVNPNL